MTRRRRSRQEWSRICEELEASGEAVQVFAQRRRLNAVRLQWWQARFGREAEVVGQTGGFVEVVGSGEPQPRTGTTTARTVIRIGERISVEFIDQVPPVAWLMELAGRC